MSQRMEIFTTTILSKVVTVLSPIAQTISSARRRSMRLGIALSRSESALQKSIPQQYLIRPLMNAKMPIDAADEQKEKASSDNFDDQGLMALVCRHDITLFFANIDTPGEQQKYAVALLEHLFSLIPTCATVVSLYDIGYVLDCSLHLVSMKSFLVGTLD